MYSQSSIRMTPFSVSDLGEGDDDIVEEGGSTLPPIDEAALYRKIQRKLLPPFFLMVMLCYIDRTNLAFASIQLNADMNWPPSVYGMGSGLFFLGYAVFQIPSNLILKRVGGPIWLSIIIVTWGVCASSFSFMRNRFQFYTLRLLLGVAEAGAFPGMWYCLSQFFPPEALTVPFAIVETGVVLSHVLASPLAAGMLSLDGACGLRGWQWLFLIEGMPSVALGLCMRFLVPDGPERATFLNNRERRFLSKRIASAVAAAASHGGGSSGIGAAWPTTPGSSGLSSTVPPRELSGGGSAPGKAGAGGAAASRDSVWSALRNPLLWWMAVTKIVRDIAGFGIIFFTPLLVKAMLDGTVQHLRATSPEELKAAASAAHGAHGNSGARAALLTSLPFAVSSIVALGVAHHSEATGERIYHIALPYIVCGLLFTSFTTLLHVSLGAGFFALTAGVVAIYSGGSLCLALVSEVAAGPGLLLALPFYNSVGNIGGFLGPYFVGLCLQYYNSFTVALPVLGLSLVTSGIMILAIGPWLPRSAAGRAKPT